MFVVKAVNTKHLPWIARCTGIQSNCKVQHEVFLPIAHVKQDRN